MTTTIHCKFLYLTMICSFFLTHYSLKANNGEVETFFTNGTKAYAYPVNSIVIDGNSEDWPSNLEKYPIALSPYGALPSKKDIDAYFQIGHNLKEQALYILVKVIDDIHKVDSSQNAAWYTQDTYTLFLDYVHDWNGSDVSQFQFGEHFNNELNSDTNWEKVKIKMSRSNNTTTYEIKVMLGNHLKLNKTIGLDHSIVDKDDDQNVSLINWGPGGNKNGFPDRLGDIIPVAQNTKIAQVIGKVSWQENSIKKMPDRITLVNKKNKTQWTNVEVDSLGNYNTSLPEGSYFVKPFWEFRDAQRIDLENSKSIAKVRHNKVNQAPELKLVKKVLPDLIPKQGIIQEFNPDEPSRLDNFVKAYQDYYIIPGISLAIIKDGKVVYHKTYGNRNNVTREVVDEKSLFEAASITKPVFAFAVNSLIEKGIIDLDRPLYTYLPFEAIAHDERYKLITARHVLSHQTGFPNWAHMNPDGKLDIKFTPGTAFGYSGEGFEYLKRVVVKVTGKDIETILQEEVLDPLNLKNIYFSKNDYLKTHVAYGHYGRFPSAEDIPDEPYMAFSMYTEARSFANFALSILERKGLNSDTYNKMLSLETKVDSERPQEGWEEFFGLGIALEKTPFGPAFGHTGSNGDNQCEFKIYTELNAGFIVFTNSDHGNKLLYDLDEFLISGKINDY